MNLVALLIAPAVVRLSIGPDASAGLRALFAIVAFGIIVTAIVISKRRKISLGNQPEPVKQEPVSAV
jgi:K(+)-stimulated pyrophosphate-energized sodium pump